MGTIWEMTRARTRRLILRTLILVRAHVPPGLRLLLGVLLMIGGVFSILPFLGLWMLPAGFYVAALDVVPMWRWLRGRRRVRVAAPISAANPSIPAG